jgi:hypothetical protein
MSWPEAIVFCILALCITSIITQTLKKNKEKK